jgi:hypothetical protein
MTQWQEAMYFIYKAVPQAIKSTGLDVYDMLPYLTFDCFNDSLLSGSPLLCKQGLYYCPTTSTSCHNFGCEWNKILDSEITPKPWSWRGVRGREHNIHTLMITSPLCGTPHYHKRGSDDQVTAVQPLHLVWKKCYYEDLSGIKDLNSFSSFSLNC